VAIEHDNRQGGRCKEESGVRSFVSLGAHRRDLVTDRESGEKREWSGVPVFFISKNSNEVHDSSSGVSLPFLFLDTLLRRRGQHVVHCTQHVYAHQLKQHHVYYISSTHTDVVHCTQYVHTHELKTPPYISHILRTHTHV
jgi:hypothetical protein